MKDVLVQVDKFYFLVDFVVLDTQLVVNQGTQFLVILVGPSRPLPIPLYIVGED